MNLSKVPTNERPRLWAVVPAAGPGTRLAPMTRALYGHDLPEPHAVLAGERSLLQVTLDRLAPLVPASRTVVVVAEPDAGLARAQLAGYRGIDLVVQPRDLGTAPGVLLPLARVLARDPTARVVVAPAGHHVRNARPMLQGLATTVVDLALRDRVTLLGVPPEHDGIDHGWIVRGGRLSSAMSRTPAWEVAELHEPPARDASVALRARGALWNTSLLGGAARVIWKLVRAHLPVHADAFDRYLAAVDHSFERAALARIYTELAPASFGRDVLAHASGLAVIPVAGAGWCDRGAPALDSPARRGAERYGIAPAASP